MINIKCMWGYHTQETEIEKFMGEDGKNHYIVYLRCSRCKKHACQFEYIEHGGV